MVITDHNTEDCRINSTLPAELFMVLKQVLEAPFNMATWF